MEVRLWRRDGKKRTTLSLAIWRPGSGEMPGKWTYEPLKMYLYPGKECEAQNKETLRLAEVRRSKRYLEINAEQDGEITSHKRQEDFIAFFEDVVFGRGEFAEAGPKDKNWRQALRVLREYSPGPVPFRSINNAWLLGFQNFLLKNYKQNWSWMLHAKVRAGLFEAYRKKRLPRDIRIEVKPIPYKNIKKVFLTIAEIQKLAKTPIENDDFKRAFLFSCFAGLRYSDLCKLTWENVKGDFLNYIQEKTGEEVMVPLHPNAKEILEGQKRKSKVIDPRANVFKMLSNTRVNQLVKIWGRRAGIQKKLTFHTARHTCAFLNLDSEVSIYDVQTIMGHRKLSTTEDYAHQHAEGLRRRLAAKVQKVELAIRDAK